MQISNTAALLIVVLSVLGLLVLGGCKKASDEKFTRTCLSADSNCKFVRQHVDYVSQTGPKDCKTQTGANAGSCQGLERLPTAEPHYMADPTDKLQNPDQGPVNLIKDEDLLWNQDKLYQQYTHNYTGCGNGKPYIVNDDKTRFALREVGDEWAARILEAQHIPQHGGPFSPADKNYALTDLDMAEPDVYSQLYGAQWLNEWDGVPTARIGF